MSIDWKPCRVVHCYKIENGVAHIIGFDGIIRLNKSAAIVWDMSNGKNSVKEILAELKKEYCNITEDILFRDIKNIIDTLSSRGILIKDWDPLLKDNISHKTRGYLL